LFRGLAQPGRAPVLGTGGCEFKSRVPDHCFSGSTFVNSSNRIPQKLGVLRYQVANHRKMLGRNPTTTMALSSNGSGYEIFTLVMLGSIPTRVTMLG
jgi:hypothetical protein